MVGYWCLPAIPDLGQMSLMSVVRFTRDEEDVAETTMGVLMGGRGRVDGVTGYWLRTQ